MNKRLPILLSFLVFSFFVFAGSVSAASLNLTNIGALDTGGNVYAEWWYTGTEPVFRGTANANSEVLYDISGEVGSVKADDSGNWSYASSLGSGDYEVAFSSEGEYISFVLHAGQSFPGDTSETTPSATPDVPATGSNQLIGLISSLSLISLGLFVANRKKKLSTKAFERDIIKNID